ncbi:MAG: hypothetical protein FGM44_16305, partial [Limnohabitans sp.]|nr:hypothetical protein [Limnohabitans sp.]
VQDKVSDAKGGDGRDVLKNIEVLNFSDASEQLVPFVNNWGTQTNTNGTRYGDKLVGDATVNNWIDGRAGTDWLVGGAGVDTLQGGEGNDTLDGGAGSSDSAKFNAPLSQFQIQRVVDDSTGTVTGVGSTDSAPSYFYRVSHLVAENFGGQGTDTVFNVEKLQFSDANVNLSQTAEQGGSFWIGGVSIPTEYTFRGTLFDDKVSGRSTGTTAANEQFLMNSGNDTVLAGNGADYVDGGAGDDYIELGNDPYTTATTPPAAKDIARLGPGNDTVIGGYSTSELEADKVTGVPSGTRFTVTAGGQTVYYTDTQWDIVRYDDDASRYTVSIHRNSGVKGVLGDKVAVYVPGTVSDFAAFDIGAEVFHGSFKAVDAQGVATATDFSEAYQSASQKSPGKFNYHDYVVVVKDSLSDALGGDGTDVLLGIDSISFEGSSLYINTSPVSMEFTGDAAVVPDVVTGYKITTSANGLEQTLSGAATAGTYATIVTKTPNYIDGTLKAETLTGTDGNDSMQGWAGDDVLVGGKGDDYMVGGIGNDTLRGGEDGTTDPNNSGANTFGFGDKAAYKNSLPTRFEIRKLVDDATGSLTGTANQTYFRVVDTASLVQLTKGSDGFLTEAALASSNQKLGVGFGIDTLIGVERILIGDTKLDLAVSSNTWQSNGFTRSYFGGTFFDDVLIGTSHADELDGRGGNDTLDGGVEADDLVGNEWDTQDIVRYTGDRERFEVRGVTVQVGGSGTSKTYTVVPAGQTAAANTTLVNAIQVKDQLSSEDGGSGTDLLVNIERLEFNGFF